MNEESILPNEPHLHVEVTTSDDYSRYLLFSRTDILFVLRALIESRDLIMAFLDEGNESLLTSLLQVNEEGMVLDCGNDDETNRRALAAKSAVFVTAHDKVKIQFSAPGLQSTQFEGRPAFRAELPDKVLRLQRREYYRLVAPASEPLACAIPMLTSSGGKHIIEAQVLDLSAGGVAIIAPPRGIDFAVDDRFVDCLLRLPHAGPVRASLRVRNIFDVTLRNGVRLRRYGCQFLDLPGSTAAQIERYIMRIERARKARQSGLG